VAEPSPQIGIGMGGWKYAPWRETFYPPEVKAAQELEYASRQVTAIEINSTFYRLQNAAVFAKWRDATPEDFVFCVKAPRFIVQRKRLEEGVESIPRFLESGIAELGNKLGPILWQLAPTYEFDVDDLGVFLSALPTRISGVRLRHAVNVRHKSFQVPAFVKLAKRHGIAIVLEDDAKHPAIADVSADFVYARLRRCQSKEPTGYPKREIGEWARRATEWASGSLPDDLAYIEDLKSTTIRRDVFVFFINGAKERAPAAARALISALAK
jgi:uncharacterized protein YecE (DUF72 family)